MSRMARSTGEMQPSPSTASESSASLMTALGVVEGEVLTYLEEHGSTPVRRLTRELQWPAPMVIMAAGALIRSGLVRATQYDLEVILEEQAVRPRSSAAAEEDLPQVWGG